MRGGFSTMRGRSSTARGSSSTMRGGVQGILVPVMLALSLTAPVVSVAAAAAPATAIAAAATQEPQASPPPDPDTPTVVITDDVGRTVTFEERPCRIVSLIPAATEIVFALGGDDCLAGRSKWDDYPPGVEDIPDVGLAIGADVERVVAQDPDLVLLVSGSDNARSLEDFERLDVPSLVLRFNRLGDLRAAIFRLGRLLDRAVQADSLWDAIETDLANVRRRTEGLERPVVYYDIAFPPPITIGRGSYLDTLIAIAGGENAFHDVRAASPTVSLEAIAVRDPDIIVFPFSEAWGGATDPAERPLWSNLRAVRGGNVRRVDAQLLHRLGPRIGRAVRALARAFHPEAFEPEAFEAESPVGGASP